MEGLTQAGFADLDGDGLADLWGNVDGELRAFRGEAPEAWRALGRFDPAYTPYRAIDLIRDGWVDLDGDGVADTLDAQRAGPWGLAAPVDRQPHRAGSLGPRRPRDLEDDARLGCELVRTPAAEAGTSSRHSRCPAAT